jgi:hypothetical protein
MQSEISIWLGKKEEDIEVERIANTEKRHALQVRITQGDSESVLCFYGSPEDIAAFIERIAQLKGEMMAVRFMASDPVRAK